MTNGLKNPVSWLLMLSGYALLGTAGTLFVYCDFGADAFNLLNERLSILAGVQPGTAGLIVQGTLLLPILLMDWRRISVGTLLGGSVIAFVNNAWAPLLAPLLAGASVPVRALCMLFVPVVVGLGIALVQHSNTGMVPNDLFPFLVSLRLKKLQYRTVRILFDFSELLLGVLLGATISGGDIGLGTVTATLLVGPSLQFWLKVISPLGQRAPSAPQG